jgi:hypothetical protein
MSTYMAYLPYPVRHSRNLSAAAKLLFAELTTFADKQARTRVKNLELCELFSVDERTISRWLIELKKHQFIEVFQKGPERIITITTDAKFTPTKMSVYPDKNVGLTPTKMSTNTLYTSFTNVKGGTIEEVSAELLEQQPEKSVVVPPSLIEVKNYAECHAVNLITAEKFWNYYEASNWELRPGVPVRRWQRLLQNWKLSDDTQRQQQDIRVEARQKVRQELNVTNRVDAPPIIKQQDLSHIDAAYAKLSQQGGAQ